MTAAEFTDADADEIDALIARERALNAHFDCRKPTPEPEPKDSEVKTDRMYVNGEVAYRWAAWDWKITPLEKERSVEAFFGAVQGLTVPRINDDLAEHRGLEYDSTLDVEYSKPGDDGLQTQTIGHITKTSILLNADDTDEQVSAAFADLATKAQEFDAHKGSG